MEKKYWELELNEYIRQGEPDRVDKSHVWKTAIGLQDVDGLKPSDYLNAGHELKTRTMHIDYAAQSASSENSKCNNCTLEELAIMNVLIKNPSITQKDLAGVIGKSERTVKSRTVEMQEKGLIARENGKRNGKWTVLIEVQNI